MLENWQIEVIEQLLSREAEVADEVVDISTYRLFLESPYYGKSRYHVVTRSYDGGLVIDQIEHGEHHLQRVSLDGAQIGPLLRFLLARSFQQIAEQAELKKEQAERRPWGAAEST